MGELASLTSADSYFENFEAGQTIRHARGKTVTELENVNITNMVMNTAQGHFNQDRMAKSPVGRILCYGGVSLSVVLGLASQDTVENALAELGLDKIRLRTMVFHGDTLYAYSRVLAKRESDREDAGIVVFKHWGVNQNRELVVEAERTALVKRKSHWLGR
ncbi:MAG: MaoC family dehydratase [Gammaproteobacteria bacterium]|nr:MaoC family dehydratase [Gammaproteobacteria bacterium]